MADGTGIAWTDATWNPVRGCTRVSEGCRHCYAETVAARFSDQGAPFHGFAERGRPGSKWTGRVEVVWPMLDQMLRWRRPRRIFANSMSDLFHEALPAGEIATIYAVMVAAVHLRGHTLQVLTKRSARMRALLTDLAFWDQVNAEVGAHVMERTDPLDRCRDDARDTLDEHGPGNPPPGIWLGTSVENQAAADERVPELLGTPAAIRFLSCEPLLGDVDIRPWLPGESGCENCDDDVGGGTTWCSRHDIPREQQCPARFEVVDSVEGPMRSDGCPAWVTCHKRSVDWVICGGESGPGARPMSIEWARSLREQCAAAGVPFFFKQIGSAPGPDWGRVAGKGTDPAGWPPELRVQHFPEAA